MSADSKDLAKLHELMCTDALEGGLSLDESVACQQLTEQYEQVNTQFYWEALGAADLVLDGSSATPPQEVREGWIALSESLGMSVSADDRLDQTVAVWNDNPLDVEQYAEERALSGGQPPQPAARNWPWVVALLLALAGAGFWLYPDVRNAVEREPLFQQWRGTLAPEGVERDVTLALTGEVVGNVVWDADQQRGRIEVNSRAMSFDVERQPQVWLIDSDRSREHIPVALLSANRVLHTVDLVPPVQIRQFAGVLITSEPLGGSLNPSRTHILAVSNTGN